MRTLGLLIFCYSLTAIAEPFMRIAHRGSPTFAPENTISSFEKAIELKANYLELDVHQTKDQVLVVLHDNNVDRTTDGEGKVSSFSLNDIQKLDAGIWFHEKFKGLKIPTLNSVLELLVANPEVKAIIELKEGDLVYPGMEKRVVNLVHKKSLDNRVIFKSFDPDVLARIKKLVPTIPSLYVFVMSVPGISLTVNTSLAFHSPYEVQTQILQIHYYFITKGFVKKAHELGYKVVVWGVDTKEQMRKSLELNVDGIETDRLDLLDEIIKLN